MYQILMNTLSANSSRQAVNPFYVFQTFTVALWCAEGYYLYSVCVAVLSAISILIMVWETRRVGQGEAATIESGSDCEVYYIAATLVLLLLLKFLRLSS